MFFEQDDMLYDIPQYITRPTHPMVFRNVLSYTKIPLLSFGVIIKFLAKKQGKHIRR